MNHVRRSLIDQKAKQIEKEKGLKWSKALDEAAKEYGFSNFRHYSNVLKEASSEKNLKVAKKDFSKSSDLFIHLKNASPKEVQETCRKLDLKFHTEQFLLDEIQNKRSSPFQVTLFSKSFQKEIKVEFSEMNYELVNGKLNITGTLFAKFDLFRNDENIQKRASRHSDRFDGSFLVTLDSNNSLALEKLSFSDEKYRLSEA